MTNYRGFDLFDGGLLLNAGGLSQNFAIRGNTTTENATLSGWINSLLDNSSVSGAYSGIASSGLVAIRAIPSNVGFSGYTGPNPAGAAYSENGFKAGGGYFNDAPTSANHTHSVDVDQSRMVGLHDPKEFQTSEAFVHINLQVQPYYLSSSGFAFQAASQQFAFEHELTHAVNDSFVSNGYTEEENSTQTVATYEEQITVFFTNFVNYKVGGDTTERVPYSGAVVGTDYNASRSSVSYLHGASLLSYQFLDGDFAPLFGLGGGALVRKTYYKGLAGQSGADRVEVYYSAPDLSAPVVGDIIVNAAVARPDAISYVQSKLAEASAKTARTWVYRPQALSVLSGERIRTSELDVEGPRPDGDNYVVSSAHSSSSGADLRTLVVGSAGWSGLASISSNPSQTARDKLYGADGDDILVSFSTTDGNALNAGNGSDVLIGSDKVDLLHGGSGDDALLAGDGADMLNGDSGNDWLLGGNGNDTTYGGGGDDHIVAELNDGDDTIDGGFDGFGLPLNGGVDTVVYSYAQGESTIKIVEGAWFSGQKPSDFGISISGAKDAAGAIGDFGNDKLTSIEKGAVEAGSGADTLVLDGKSYYGYIDYIDLGTQGSGLSSLDTLDASLVTTNIIADFRNTQAQSLVINDGVVFDSTLKLRNVENVIGSSHDDLIYGVSGTTGSRLQGGAGRDTIYGGNQADDLQGGSGDDIIDGGGGTDAIDGGTGADILVVDGLDTVARGEAEDKLYWKKYSADLPFANQLRGGERTVKVYDTQTWDEQISAMLNSTALYKGNLGETYELTGSGEDQALKITMTSGEIVNLAHWNEGEFGIRLYTNKDRQISFGTQNFQAAGLPTNLGGFGVDTFILGIVAFAVDLVDPVWKRFDGNSFDLTQLRDWASQPGQLARSNNIEGTEAGEAISGHLGDDRVLAFGGDDSVDGLTGDDTLIGGSGNDSLVGNLGADRLEGGDGDDILDGGLGDDTIVTGTGKDLVIVRAGGGADLIIADTEDTIRFEGVKSTDVTLRAVAGGLTPQYGSVTSGSLSFAFGADSVTLQGASFGSIEYADGVVQTAAVMARNAIAAATSAADDTIIGFGTDDRLAGGAGNDYLNGLGGSDRYYFGIGDGQDRIEDSEGVSDRIVLGTGITPANLVVTTSTIATGNRAGRMLAHLGVAGTSDWIEFVVGDIEEVRFANGTKWDGLAILTSVYAGQATAGDDHIAVDNFLNYNGGAFRPGAGNDTITVGKNASAILQFGAGAQLDRVDLTAPEASANIDLDAGISIGDLRIQRLGNGLSVKINGTSDRVEATRSYDGVRPYTYSDISLTSDGTTLGTSLLERIADVDPNVAQRLTGTSTNDTLNGVSGSDWLSGGAGNDTIAGNDGADLLFGGVGNDNLSGGADRDILLGEAGDDILDGGAGDDSLLGGTGTDTLIGGAGNDELTGNGHSTLNGGTGNDLITASYGDMIVYNLGDGADTVSLFNGASTLDGSTTVQRPEISLGTGITAAQTTLTLVGWSVYININGSTTDRIRLDRLFQNANMPQIRFTDGTIWKETDILGKLFAPNNGDDTPAGVISIEPNYFNSNLAYIYGGAGNDSLTDQAPDATYAAERRYLFTRGSGNDVIDGAIHPSSLMLYGFDPDQMSIARSGAGLGDLTLSFSGATNTVKINGQQKADGSSIISNFIFSGADLSSDKIRERYLAQVSTSGADTITAFDGLGGVSDVGYIPGFLLSQNPGNDRLQGGLGNDLMIGGSGDDTYVVNVGDGQDIIRDLGLFNPGAAAGYDTLLTNALSTNAIFKRSTTDSKDLIITFSNSSDQITIDEFFALGRIEQFEFGDGVVFSTTDVEQLAIQGSVTSGADVIKGSASPETITGGAGNDTLDGLGGADRYLFNLGNGQDVVSDSGTAETNTLAFGPGIVASQINFLRLGNDLKAVINASDSVTITGQFAGAAVRPIGQLVFADGTRKSAAEVDQILLAQMATTGNDSINGFSSDDLISGGAGNDTLNGGDGADTLNGGTGNDTLNGQLGSDIYLIARGDGTDVIASTGDATAVDVVRFAEGIALRDLALTRASPTAPDLVVTVRGTSQTVTISNYFTGPAIKQLELADGTVLAAAEVSAALANLAPAASAQTWRMTAIEGEPGRVAVPDGLFTDDYPVGEVVYKASLASGASLPSWLTFDGLAFQSTANDAQVGTYAIKLTAVDRYGASIDRTVQLDVLNRDEAPAVGTSAAVQTATVGQSFGYTLQAGLFTDQDQLFTAAPAAVAGTYASDHGSFSVQTSGAYTYTPTGAYSGPDKVYVPFTLGTGQPLQIAYSFTSSGSTTAGSLPAGLAPKKDTLTLTARQANGSALPTWLYFNGSAFSGTPAAGDAGPLAIDVFATDAGGRQTVAPLSIRVGSTNSAPTASNLPALVATQNEAFSYTLATNAFSDANPCDRLTLSASLSDGSPLPAWLSFDGATLVGTPANTNVGALSLRITATDIYGATATLTTGLTVLNVNDAPTASATIANQLATQGQAFSFTVPSASFADPDVGDTLSLSATRDTGEPLPAWLSFVNGVFTGTPGDEDTGLIRLRVTATDVGGKAASQEFVLGIVDTNDAPVVAETLSPLVAPVSETTIFHIPDSLFFDADEPSYRLSVSLSDGSALPDWIVYDPDFNTISLSPGFNQIFGKTASEAGVAIKITATDPRGASVSTILSTSVVAPSVTSTLTGSGSNPITGTFQSERIDSGPGSSSIKGGGGVDRVVFGRGSGQDTLSRGNDTIAYPLGDIVELGANIALGDLTFARIDDGGGTADSGKNVLVTINGTSDQLRINQQFGGKLDEEPTVREFVFADGSRLTAAQVQALFAAPTGGNDIVRGGNQADSLSGGGGDDSVIGFDGSDTLDGGAGNDKLFGDQPTGSGVYGGSDTFLFGRGSGSDIVFSDNFSSTTLTQGVFEPSRGTDTLRFGANIAPSDLIVNHVAGYPDESQSMNGQDAGSLLIQIAGTSDSVKLDHQFYLRYFYKGGVNTLGIERFEFADGTVMNRAQFESLITLAATTTGDDIIAGGAGADRLAGGAGDDILVGEDGADTYVYNPGEGNDRILETMQQSRPTPLTSPIQRAGDIVSTDAISFGAGIRPEDIVFTRPDPDGENLVISFKNQAGSISIDGQFRNIWHGGDTFDFADVTSYYGTENAAIDEVRFSDGTKWSLSDIYAFSMKATAGADIIDGFFRPSETLDGGAGNDLLAGRNGDDTYVFARGYGNDTVKEFGWLYSDNASSGQHYTPNDSINFVGVASTDVSTSIGAGGSFIFKIINTGETLSIASESEFNNFKSIVFSDTTWTAAQFQTRWTIASATAGNDIINGFVGNDVISGGDGNDTLQGGQNSYDLGLGSVGFDTLNGGNGNDTLTVESSDGDHANGDAGDDIFRIAMTLPWESKFVNIDPNRGRLDYPNFVPFGTESGTIDGGIGNDKLILGGKLSDYWLGNGYVSNNGDGSYSFKGGLRVSNVETVQFADATLSFASVAAATTPYRPGAVEGTAGNDVMNGTAGNDALYGLAGNDTLNGLDGDDFLIGGAGTDSYNGGNGTDIVEYSDDTVGWTINLSNGQATQSTTTETLTAVEGAYGSTAADTITGSGNVDVIAGGGGDDNISAGAGNDTIIFEGSATGYDAIDGGAGTDTIKATFDNTVVGLTSIAGVEAISANGFVNVVISGSSAANTLDLSAVTVTGIARIDGGAGNDVVTGSVAGDAIAGGSGDDTLNGGQGNDTFTMSGTSDGYDAVTGGAGNDVILAGGNSTRIGLSAISEIETISANGFSGVYLQGSTAANTLDFTSVALAGIARIDGGGGNDVITGSAGADVILGSAGDDTLNGGLGDDQFQFSGSSNGFDLLNGGAGTNSIIATANSTVIGLSGVTGIQSISAGTFTGVSIAGSANGDALDFSTGTLSGITKIDAGSGNDVVTGSAGSDVILGSAGDDTLSGGGGNDTFQYTGSSNGFDAVDGGAGTDAIMALAASTVIGLTSINGVETIGSGGFSGVTVAGSANADTLNFAAMTLTGIASVNGGAGNDLITGSAGSDTLIGGADNDTLGGGGGDDTLNGGVGTNVIDGGAGADVAQYSGAAGSYSVAANGDGTYNLVGTGISDTLSNVENLNFSDGTVTVASRVGLGLTLVGTASAETLTGGGNNDTITGLGGDDTLIGGAGNDLFRVTGTGDGFDSVDGGAGTDTIGATVANAVIGLTSIIGVEAVTSGGFSGVSIAGSSAANALNFAASTLTGITKIDGGAGNDIITGSAAADTILGSAGDDALDGGDGNDLFQYNGSANGFDAVAGGNGTDTISALANSTVIGLSSVSGVEAVSAGSFTGVSIAGSANADNLDFTGATLTAITKIDGGAGNDVIVGSAGADTMLGSGGDDNLQAGGGNDTVQYTGTANGFDAVDGGAGTDAISALANATVIGLSAVAGIETISAGSFTGVYIAGSANADTLNFSSTTLTAITKIDAGLGDDVITGSGAADTLFGSDGNDLLSSGAGNDSLSGDNNDDTLIGGAGNDTINGGAGTDTVDYSYATANLTVSLAVTTAQTVATGDADTITNVENLTGGSGADTIAGSSVANVLKGGSGNDRITGGAGNDNVDGGLGADVAVFAGTQASYTITTTAGTTTIVDNQTTTDGNDGTDTLIGTEKAEFKGGVQVGLAVPIVLDLDGNGVSLVDRSRSRTSFDWDGDGKLNKTGWVGAGDGILVFDRNGDGKVNGARELSFVDDKPGAKSDLDGLSAFDSDHNGIFSASDDEFDAFQVWRDRNSNGRSDKGELMTLGQAGIASITLAGAAVERNWGWGDNLVINTGSFTRINGATGALGDVALNYATKAPKTDARDGVRLAASRLVEAAAAFGTDGGSFFVHAEEDRHQHGGGLFASRWARL